MLISPLVLTLLALLLLGAMPLWPYSRNWGFYPSGAIGLVLTMIMVLLLLNQL